MEAKVSSLTCEAFLPSSSLQPHVRFPHFKSRSPIGVVLRRCISKEEPFLEGMPKEYYDDEATPAMRLMNNLLNIHDGFDIAPILNMILLWAPFFNFRKFPRDPSMKYSWSEPENPSQVKNTFSKFPYATPEDYD